MYRPPIWTLSDAERRAYLEYYSPIVFKRSNEDGYDQRGLDLVTNFDFDQDYVFSNNKKNWEQVYRYIEGHRDVEHWRIRPTLYTALIEFMEPDETKSMLLLYHIYHAKQIGSIHDWERVEVRIDDVYGTPGQGSERLDFVVITNHGSHKARKNPASGSQFHGDGYRQACVDLAGAMVGKRLCDKPGGVAVCRGRLAHGLFQHRGLRGR